ncbi:MAG TPA: signal recognition particle protein, partial [Candidatus Hydrogenedentes bacterium]|nr:signal recognition particle protein [Candidatus Hydrogenedentota bacterium]
GPIDELDDDAFKYQEAIVLSMTAQERHTPKIINGSRRRRIAAGSGTTVQDVNQFLKEFEKTRKMIKRMMKGSKGRGPRGRGPMISFPGL